MKSNTECFICKIPLWRKPSRKKKYPHSACTEECRRKISSVLFLGRNNGACKYKDIDDSLFSDITILEEWQAYLLGLIASDGHVRKKQIVIGLHNKDIDILLKLCEKLNLPKSSLYKKPNSTQIVLTLNSKQIATNLCNILGIEYNAVSHKKSHTVKFPEGLSQENYRHFIRGFFDGDGWIGKNLTSHNLPVCGFTSNSPSTLFGIINYVGIKNHIHLKNMSVHYSARQCVAFLSYIYENSTIYLDRKYNLYQKHKKYVPKNRTKASIYMDKPKTLSNN